MEKDCERREGQLIRNEIEDDYASYGASIEIETKRAEEICTADVSAKSGEFQVAKKKPQTLLEGDAKQTEDSKDKGH